MDLFGVLLRAAGRATFTSMTRRLLLSLALCFLFLLDYRPSAAQSGSADELLQSVNQARAAYGLPAYEVDASLMTAAQGQASWVMSTGNYGHAGSGGSRPQDRANAAGYRGYVAENYVAGTGLTPPEAVTWWLTADEVHRGTVLSQNTQMGAGYASDGTTMLYVLVVGRPSGAPASQPQSAPANDNAPAGDGGNQPPAVFVPSLAISTPRDDGSVIHIVRPGETAWDIAAAYHVDLAELLAINLLGDDPLLVPGEAIIVRLGEGQLPPTATPLPLTHTVQSGETAWSIAAQYHLELNELLALNGLPENQRPLLMPGDVLIIRREGPATVPSGTATPTEPPTQTPLPSPFPTSVPTSTEVLVSPTSDLPVAVAAMATSSETPALTLTATVVPTQTPLPPRMTDLEQTLLTGGAVIGLGLAGFAGVAAILGIALERRHKGK